MVFASNGKSFAHKCLSRASRILPMLALPVLMSAATYYANPAGSDSNPGTYTQPFRTVARGIQAATPGDSVVLQDGTYPADTPYGGGSTNGWLLWINKSGTAGAPITLMAEHKQKAILDCGNAYNGPHTGCMGYFYLGNPGPAYWIFQDLVITNTYDIAFLMNATTPAHDITVKGCWFHNIGQHVSSSTSGLDGIYVNQGHYNIVLDGNVFNQIGRLPGSTYPFNDHALYLHSTNTTVKNNVFYGTIAGWGVQTAIGFSGLIANNTFAFSSPNTGGQLMLWDVAGGNITVQNNLFYQPPQGFAVNTCALVVSSLVMDHNMIYGGVVGPTETCGRSTPSFSGANTNNSSNPLFNNLSGGDFHLLSGSPAINTGLTVGSVPVDHDGVARPQGGAYDIGAFEFSSGTSTSTTPQISSVSAANIGSNSATITWTTNVSASSQVKYGVTSYSATSSLNSSPVTQHTVLLSNLTAGTTYQYACMSTTSAGTQVTSANFKFTTAPQASTSSGLALSSSPASLSLAQGSSSTVKLSAALTSGTAVTVSFSASGLPSGVTASFSPSSCTVPCSSTMTLAAATAASAGSFGIGAHASSGAGTASTNVTLSVSAPVTSMVASWGFNEGTGIYTADASGHGNTGQLFGSAAWAKGTYGTAISFNGTSSYVNVPEKSSLDLSGNMTVAFWIDAANVSGVDQRIVSKNYDWDVKLNGGNHIPQLSSGPYCAALNYAMPMGSWQHIVFTLSSGTVKGYVNGAPVSLAASTFPAGFVLPNYKYGLYVGTDAGQSMFAKGLIDDVRIYNTALSASQVASLYSQTWH